ncbi:hypothetical protein BUALT_Bualt11G0001100 [Buddleja alternifolia]|uniref:Uncharacterized protein n=1 Tax=Buddleja alternifolia TaxID=168488 RepID=A0AAV6WRH9_9LAMI|nr:hypothetical protein BUALT_Bualt11G0001100 [Buddleja alternifolia]
MVQMDAFDFNDDNLIKADTYSDLSMAKIKKLFRIVEVFLILVFLSWASAPLPFAVRIAGEYFRRVMNILSSPLFIFLISNGIVLTLFFKSRHLLINRKINNSPPHHPEEIIFKDKQTIFEVRKGLIMRSSQSESSKRSEKKDTTTEEGCRKQLFHRSGTEKRRLRVAADDGKAAAAEGGVENMVDELSNEEFQSAIESFIAKQIMFHKQEKLAIVLHAPTTAAL